ncbi:ParA family protein [Xanthomonas albilineans]|uniref:ParA family protein n=1 Tax=Xanthomonas albilineans TaxID=29447 RepID=UPI0005F2FE96|nr:ParA family protein [Xanthomonas albilineans]
MIVLALAGQKGGSAKTTTAVHLGVEYVREGRAVAVIDTDPQGSARKWAEVRESADVPVAAVTSSEVEGALRDAENDGYQIVIIDTPPHMSPALAPILRRATLVILPFRPTPLDLATLPAARRMVEAAGTPAVALLTSAPVGVAEIEPMRDAIEAGGVRVLKTVIHHRVPFYRAISYGQAVAEFDPKGAAAEEIRQLRIEIDQVLKDIQND